MYIIGISKTNFGVPLKVSTTLPPQVVSAVHRRTHIIAYSYHENRRVGIIISYYIVNTTPCSHRRYGFVVVGLWPAHGPPARRPRLFDGLGEAGAWETTVSFRELSRLARSPVVVVIVLAVVVGGGGGGGGVRRPNFNKRIGGGGISSCSPQAPYSSHTTASDEYEMRAYNVWRG